MPRRQKNAEQKNCVQPLQSTNVCLFVCLVFNGTFSTNRLYREIVVGKYHVGTGDNIKKH